MTTSTSTAGACLPWPGATIAGLPLLGCVPRSAWLGSPGNGHGVSAMVIGSSPQSEPGGSLSVSLGINSQTLAKTAPFPELAGGAP